MYYEDEKREREKEGEGDIKHGGERKRKTERGRWRESQMVKGVRR